MRAVKNFFTLFFGDGISYLLNFFVIVYLARTLEVSNFGKLSFAFAFFSFGSFLTNMGLISIGTRDIAQTQHTGDSSLENRYITNVITLRQLLAAVIFVLLLAVAFLINKSQEVKLLIIFYGLSLFPFALLLEWTFLGWEKMTVISINKIITAISYFALIFIFIKTPQQLTTVPLLFFISYTLGALFILIIYLRRKKSSFSKYLFKFRFNDWRQLIKNALPIGIGALLIQFSLNFNVIFLGLMKNNLDVGLFSASSKILFFILIFDRVMNNTTFPIISRYFMQGKEKLSDVLNRLNKLILVIAMPVCAGGFILAKEITVFIYGSKYEQSFMIFRILIWFFFITILNSLYTSSLIAGQKNKEYVSAIGYGVISNVVLNIILVPMFGATGTAISLITAEFVTLIFLSQKIKPIARLKFNLINIIKPLIATILMVFFIVIFQSKITIIPLAIISAIVYAIVIIITKGVTKSDLAITKIKQ